MILRKSGIEHMMRSVVVVTNCNDIVLVGSAALIAIGRRLPAILMMTDEADIYVRDAADPDDIHQLIEGTFGIGSQFQKTFKYHVDAVSPSTSIFPADWESRATILVVADAGEATVTCPSADDLAIAKIVAWRDKDVAWLKACLQHRFVDADRMRLYVQTVRPEDLARHGLDVAHLLDRIATLAA